MTPNQLELQDQIKSYRSSNETRPIAQNRPISSITHFHSCTRNFYPSRFPFPRHTALFLVLFLVFRFGLFFPTPSLVVSLDISLALSSDPTRSTQSNLSITQHTHTRMWHVTGRKHRRQVEGEKERKRSENGKITETEEEEEEDEDEGG